MLAKYRGKTYRFTVKVRKPTKASKPKSEYERLLRVKPSRVSEQLFPAKAKYRNKTVYPKKDAKKLARSYLNDYVFVRHRSDPEFYENGDIRCSVKRKDEELPEYMIRIDESNVSDFSLYTNDMSKAVKIGYGLKENYTYKYPNNNKSKHDMLYSKEGQCMHWALLYRELLRSVGIPCMYIESQKRNHAANLVYLDKKWYFVEPQNAVGFYRFYPVTKEWEFEDYTDWTFNAWWLTVANW